MGTKAKKLPASTKNFKFPTDSLLGGGGRGWSLFHCFEEFTTLRCTLSNERAKAGHDVHQTIKRQFVGELPNMINIIM